MPIEPTRRTRARRSAGLLLGVGLAVLMVAGMGVIVFLGDRAIASKAVPTPVAVVPWNVTVDPEPEWGEFKIPPNAEIRTSSSNLVFPTTPAPFVAVNPADDPKVWQVYDLRTWKPLWPPRKLDLPRFVPPVLSPDGCSLVGKVMGENPTVAECCGERGEAVRIKVDADPGMTVAMIDFVPACVPFIVKQRVGAYEDISGEWDVVALHRPAAPAVCQVYAGNKVIKEFSTPPFQPRAAAFSPYRNYLVIHQFGEKEGHRLVFLNRGTGEPAGALPIQKAENLRGHPAGLAFSRDGKQLALLWRLNDRPDHWGVLMCWDVATGKKLLEHDIGYLVPSMDLLWTHGGARSIQWLPDSSGWLLFGHLILRREDGTVIRKIGPEPRTASEVAHRLFLTPDRYTHFDRKTKTLSLRTLR